VTFWKKLKQATIHRKRRVWVPVFDRVAKSPGAGLSFGKDFPFAGA